MAARCGRGHLPLIDLTEAALETSSWVMLMERPMLGSAEDAGYYGDTAAERLPY